MGRGEERRFWEKKRVGSGRTEDWACGKRKGDVEEEVLGGFMSGDGGLGESGDVGEVAAAAGGGGFECCLRGFLMILQTWVWRRLFSFLSMGLDF